MAEYFAFVFFATAWAQGTEALFVVWAWVRVVFWFEVQIEAFLTVWAEFMLTKEIALWHLSEIVFMEKLARIALLA